MFIYTEHIQNVNTKMAAVIKNSWKTFAHKKWQNTTSPIRLEYKALWKFKGK